MGFNWRHIVLLVAVVFAAVWLSLPAGREQGLQLHRSGRINEAEPYLNAEHARDPGDRAVALALVDIHLKLGEQMKAAEILAGCAAKHPDDLPMAFQLADLYRQAGRLDLAISCLRTQPASPELLKRRAALAEECDDLSQAIADLEAQRTGAPTDAPLLERIAVIQGWRGDVRAKAEAQERLARLTRDPAQVETWLATATWLHDKDMRRRACVVAESLPDPGAKLLRTVVDQYQVANDLVGVQRAGARLVALHGAEPNDWMELANAEQWSGKPDAAIATLNKAVKQFPGRVDLETALMELCYDRGRLDQAYEHSARLTELADSPSHRRQTAQLANDLGRYAQARQWLAPLVAAVPMDVDAVEFDARIAWQTGDQTTARAHLQRLSNEAEANGGQPSLLRRSAQLAGEFNDTPRRQTLLEMLVRVQPRYHPGLLDLAKLYAEAGRVEPARRLVDQAAQLPGVDRMDLAITTARIELVATARLTADDPGWVAQRTRAIAALRQVLADHDDTELRVELIRLHLDGDDVASAKAELAKLGDPPLEVLVTLAQVLASHHDPAGARALLERIPALDTLPHGVLAGVALARLQLGEATLAVAAFERALVIAPETDAYTVGLADACLAAGQSERGYALLHARALRSQPAGEEQAWLDLASRYRWHDDPLGEAAVLETAQRRLGVRAALL